MNELLTLCEKYCNLDGASGSEDGVRRAIIADISGFADISTDALGNIIVFKKGEKRAKNKVMLDAHMDEVALIVTSVTDEGLLSFSCVGGISERVLCGRRVRLGKHRGVIGCVPIHLADDSQRDTLPAADSLFIDIGAKNKAEAEKTVSPGDTVYFDSVFTRFADGMVHSKALDDRFGCAVLVDMIKKPQPYDLYFTFTVQEEVGLRGAKTASFAVAPDFAVVVEATTAADVANVSDGKEVCRVNGGAVLSFMDNASVYDRELFSLAADTARENEIKYQIKQAVAGGNNAGAVISSGRGVRTAAVSLPCRYIHAPSSVACEDDMQSVSQLVAALSEKLAVL